MELSSHQQSQIPIPIPINISNGGGGGHEHMIHHHHHHHHQHHHDLAAAAAEAAVPDPIPHSNHSNLIHSSALPLPVVEPSNINGFSMPTSLDHHHDQHPIPDHHHEGREEEEHVNHILHYNSCKKEAGGLVAPAVGSSIKYKECLKNHAASMGGTATDGCGEFMPSGQQGTLEALTCSACHCHRNFHRKQVEGEQHWDHTYHQNVNRVGRKLLLSHGHHKNILAPQNSHYQPQMIMSNYNMGMGITESLPPSECYELEDQDHHHGGGGARPPVAQKLAKKRFRTKFTQDQKAKMFDFAEKVGWKIQKQEDSVIQQFCQEVGVRRRVLKVWMHNNKHNLAKKNPSPPPA